MTDDVNVSIEVEEMQRAERKRWLTVAEAQKVRKAWTAARETIDKMAEKFDADPEVEIEAQMFVLLSALSLGSFTQTCNDACVQLKDLLPAKDGGES